MTIGYFLDLLQMIGQLVVTLILIVCLAVVLLIGGYLDRLTNWLAPTPTRGRAFGLLLLQLILILMVGALGGWLASSWDPELNLPVAGALTLFLLLASSNLPRYVTIVTSSQLDRE